MPDFPALAHVAVTVKDLSVSRPWYRDLIGADPVLDEDTDGGFHHTVFSIGGTLLGLHEHPGTDTADTFTEFRMGLDHIAFACDDLCAAWDKLAALGTPFAPAPPATYYEMLDERLPGHGEPADELQRRGILLDGSTDDGDPRLLLQIFSQTMIGPVFFEFIQRKKDEGFGEGNFTALFKSIEADQIRRGALQVETT